MIGLSLQAVQQSTFRGVLDFFQKLGIYDVILPFLLIFTVLFAILEKTKVFGTDEYDGQQVPKKNLNAMAAFIIGFFVVASTKLVAIVSEFLANVVLLLLLVVMFLVLIGSFYREKEDVFLEGAWRNWFMALLLVAIILIFLHAVPTDNGSNWLEFGWLWLVTHWDSSVVASVILLVVIVIIMVLITKSPSTKNKSVKTGETT